MMVIKSNFLVEIHMHLRVILSAEVAHQNCLALFRYTSDLIAI